MKFLQRLRPVRRPVAASIHVSSGERRFDSSVLGQVLDQSLDPKQIRVGQKLNIPYELTIGDSWRDIWHSCFYQHDRLYTSDLFAQSLGFERCLLPFSFMLFLTGSMSHIDDSREVMDLGFRNAIYRSPAYPGSTFSKTFYITELRPTSSGQNTIVTVHCDLSDAETHQTVFSVDKIMLYPQSEVLPSIPLPSDSEPTSPTLTGEFREKSVTGQIENRFRLSESSTLSPLQPHQLLLHGMSRPLTLSTSMQLATLFRLTHPLLYNVERYKESELVVPGGLVLATAHSCGARSLYEVLAEELVSCSFVNRVSPQDNIAAMSYVIGSRELNSSLEEITIKTLGVKNFDIVKELEDKPVPVSLFSETLLKRSKIESICKDEIPELSNRIVCSSLRKIVRQSAHHQSIFLL